MERAIASPGRAAVLVLCAALVAVPGCRMAPSPVDRGLNTRDLIEPDGQHDVDELGLGADLIGVADEFRDMVAKRSPAGPPRNVLCLSGGGAYGAYSAGVLVGWTAAGTRPTFDTVTGISTGALIAPFAFLGPKYDDALQTFYTTLGRRDVFRYRPVRQFGNGALADTAPLAHAIDAFLTADVMAELAAGHAAGRRLYVGTTEVEGRRFVVWDVGAIAARGTWKDRDLIKRVLLGSAAIPGIFPAAKIGVTVDGTPYTEKHVDGGVSRAIFFRPPHVEHTVRHREGNRALAGTRVWAVVAGKLFADPQELKPRFLDLAGTSVSTVIYSQTRGELVEMWALCELTGMTFRMTSIPEEYPAPASSTDFDPDVLRPLFAEGYRQAATGAAWRATPPGAEPGENDLGRTGTALTVRDRRARAVPSTAPEAGAANPAGLPQPGDPHGHTHP
jgi:hypothetical protein